MSQTERIAYLDRRLREHGWVTASEAAAYFEVTPRQIKRDIEYLRWRLDAPIAYDAAHRRYRYEKPYARFRFADERRVLFSALVRGWASSEAHRDLVNDDILAAVDAAVPRDYRSVAERIRYEVPAAESVDLDVFAGLCRALRDARMVDLDYAGLRGETGLRRVEAQRLVHYGGAWYLVAFDHSRNGLRTFHLGRVRSLTVTSETVTKTESDPRWKTELESWLTAGSGIFRGGESYEAKVRLRGTAIRLAERQNWHPSQIDTPGTDAESDYVDRTVPVVDTRELLGRILAFGGDAEALSPAEFRTQWEDEIRRLSSRISRSQDQS
jgi:predicted DNA-binding transcriptional regulator YafY